MDWQDITIEFSVGKKKYSFDIIHNLEDVFHIALDSWFPRANGNFTARSLCDYINDKDSGHLAYTREDWNLVIKASKIKQQN